MGIVMWTRDRGPTMWWALLAAAGLAVAVVVALVIGRSDRPGAAANPAPISPGLAVRLATTSTEPTGADPTSATAHPASLNPSQSHRSRPHPSASQSGASRQGRQQLTPSPSSSVDPGARGPVRIQIPAAGINAPVVPIGVDAVGEVAIPVDVDTVGWYRYSPLPGSRTGSTVLVGHVDSAVQGEGAFFPLHTLNAGARIVLDLTDGRRVVYRVASRQQFVKGHVPLQALFATTGAPRLTLITCGGSFNEAIKSYRDNIVITATPTTAQSR